MAGRLREQRVAVLQLSDGTKHAVIQERHPSRSYGRQFVIVFTEAMARAAEQIKQGMTLRVLHLLPEYLDFVTFKQLRTVELGARLGTSSGPVSRAMAELHGLGIVEREGTGPRTAWRLSSDWGWNGTADQYHALRGGRLKGKKPPIRPSLQSHNAYYGK